MTRINCIPPAELTGSHLLAEYRELPRVFRLAYAAWARGEDAIQHPTEYTLGRGHVKFFYTRLAYLESRFSAIYFEMCKRGFRPVFNDIPAVPRMSSTWWQDWHPTPTAQAINRARIHDRLTNPKRSRK
jgi:deoxyribonuclease (pyrimidine dimer)